MKSGGNILKELVKLSPGLVYNASMPKVKDLIGADIAPKPTANDLLKQFLKDNKIVLVPERHESGAYFVDDGFVLNDRPQLKIRAEYEES